jgi:heptosyltransferase III
VSARPEKILALQFKYLGDAVFITPALRALQAHWPDAELHVLVADEVAPLLQNLPWLKKVWRLPRTRGRARVGETWPVVRALRREKFDRAVDFGGNDRGAILSWLSGAKIRLAPDHHRLLAKICYTQRVSVETLPASWVQRNVQLLAAWQVPPLSSTRLEIGLDPVLQKSTMAPFPPGMILCHVSTSNDRKQWPPQHWASFYQLARAAGFNLMFATGHSSRERDFLSQIKTLVPTAPVLPETKDLNLFLVWLKQAAVFISGDTGPFHFAAALGVPVIGLFGTGDSLRRAAPIYLPEQILTAADCACDRLNKNVSVCGESNPCMATIAPAQVLARLKKILA